MSDTAQRAAARIRAYRDDPEGFTGPTADDAIRSQRRVVVARDHPTWREYRKAADRAVRIANRTHKPDEPREYDVDEVVADFRAWCVDLGYVPTVGDFRENPDMPSEGWFRQWFGTYGKLCMAADLPVPRQGVRERPEVEG